MIRTCGLWPVPQNGAPLLTGQGLADRDRNTEFLSQQRKRLGRSIVPTLYRSQIDSVCVCVYIRMHVISRVYATLYAAAKARSVLTEAIW